MPQGQPRRPERHQEPGMNVSRFLGWRVVRFSNSARLTMGRAPVQGQLNTHSVGGERAA